MNVFDEREIHNWKQYEAVRQSGLYNMISRDAQDASGLSRPEYLFTVEHYSELKAAAELIGEAI